MVTPEERLTHWLRCIGQRPKWPFHVPTRCTDRNSIHALADHLEQDGGISPWFLTGWHWHPPHNPWEQLLGRHQDAHDRDGWDTHSHADLPDVSWP